VAEDSNNAATASRAISTCSLPESGPRITGASVGAGRTLEISLDLADALFDAGYTLHVDAAVEDMRDSPNDVAIPLMSDGAGTPVRGRLYVALLAYSR